MCAPMRRLLTFVLLFATLTLGIGSALQNAAALTGSDVVVRVTPDAYAMTDATLEEALQGRIVQRLPELHSLHVRLSTDESVTEAIVRLQRLPWVLMAEGNPGVRTALAPN